MDYLHHELAGVYRDAITHRSVAGIISKHLTNKRDIRVEALDGLDLSRCRTILDLGCGFGFFTMGLQNRVAPDALITGIDCHVKYREMYLSACRRAGIQGNFSARCIQSIESIPSQTIDLVVCSYALYYFPEFISHIARILCKDGMFVTITHSMHHLDEFKAFVKHVLRRNRIPCRGHLPHDDLVGRFSDENGHSLLSASFGKVRHMAYRGALVFEPDDFESFRKYFDFKHIFFVPHDGVDEEQLAVMLLDEMHSYMVTHGELRLSVNDVIFVCADPLVS